MTQEQLRMQMLAGIITEGQYKAKLNENYNLDKILDKIDEKGIKSLDNKEKYFLDSFEKEKNTPKNINKIEAQDEGLGIYIPDFEGFDYEGEIKGDNVLFRFNEEVEEEDRYRPFIYGLIELDIPFKLEQDADEIYDKVGDLELGSRIDMITVNIKYFDIIDDEDEDEDY